MEKWKDVIGFEGLYQVSSLGRLKSLNRKVWNPGMNCYRTQYSRILSLVTDKGGYLRVTLSKDGRVKQYLVHRIVAEAFLPNPNNLPQINHIDECKTNNSVDNLEWCNNEYNCNYGNHNSNISDTQSIPIAQYRLDGTFIKTWKSSREVENVLGYSNVNILRCCNGGFYSKSRQKFVNVTQAYGYKWRKINEQLSNGS